MTQPYRFNAPPGWPAMPEGWTPPAGWVPPSAWPEAPEGWQWWTPTSAVAAYPPPQVVVAYPRRMVTKQKQQTSHAFHLIMSLLTCGLWAIFVWLPIIVWHAIGPRARSVTKPG